MHTFLIGASSFPVSAAWAWDAFECLGGDLPPAAGPSCLGLFKVGQSWQRSQHGVGLHHRPSPVSPQEWEDLAVGLPSSKDMVHLAQQVMGSSLTSS